MYSEISFQVHCAATQWLFDEGRRSSVIITVKYLESLLWICCEMHVEMPANFTDKVWGIFLDYTLN